mgnify:FL=1
MSVQLMVRSAYTLLKSTLRIDDIARLAHEQGYTAVALTDLNVLHGAMAFFHSCRKYGVKALYGMELFCTLEDEEEKAGFIILARNDSGFQQLLKLSTLLQTMQQQLSLEELASYSSECYVISTSQDDYLYSLLVHEDEPALRRYLQQNALQRRPHTRSERGTR